MSPLVTKAPSHSRKAFSASLPGNKWYFSKSSHHPQNAPFELQLSVCLAQIILTYRSCAILSIYRISRMHHKAVTHLLRSETSLYTTESLLSALRQDAELLGTGADTMDLLCTVAHVSTLSKVSQTQETTLLRWSSFSGTLK